MLDKEYFIESVQSLGIDLDDNKIAQFARGLNSVPGFISTFIISPVILGVLIPMLTYSNTRKAQEKAAQEKN